MPHSACNCRCVMCDIWKGNQHLKQLTEKDISGLLHALDHFGTQQVLMTGGEALLNPNFFRLCELLKSKKIKISLHSTGLTIKKQVSQLVKWVDDIIVSLDGDEEMHDRIRNVPGAFMKLKEGLETLRSAAPRFPLSGRTVIHRHNFRRWPQIIEAAKELGLDRISFLPADVSATAFNRDNLWNDDRQHELLLSRDELKELRKVIDDLFINNHHDFESRFIAEPREKLDKIYQYYAAFYGMSEFPFKRCNAPWVSTVIEADGTVRPCFFHEAYGNLASGSLDDVINSEKAIHFRKHLDVVSNDICRKCVCYLNLSPLANLS
jgi:MoaA/NifB/PqqE/SkfB family radical SAM enzyme